MLILFYICIVDVWGLTSNGQFKNGNSSWIMRVLGVYNTDVRSMVLGDLESVRHKAYRELKFVFDSPIISDSTKGRRLLLLLQQDLLPGSSGAILETKSNRDFKSVATVSLGGKLLGWIIVIVVNAALLFYVYLFAISQDESTQDDWFRSFIMWFFMDLFLVATIMVYFTHILVPSFTRKDVLKIRSKVLDTIALFEQSVKAGVEEVEKERFNTSDYFFVSVRLAKMYPHLVESQMIRKFQTVWPRRSYNHTFDVASTYSSKTKAVVRALGVVSVYITTNSVCLPIGVQDLLSELLIVGTVGYSIILYLDLYELSPFLALLPLVFVIIIVHFLIYSDRTALMEGTEVLEKERLKKVVPAVVPVSRSSSNIKLCKSPSKEMCIQPSMMAMMVDVPDSDEENEEKSLPAASDADEVLPDPAVAAGSIIAAGSEDEALSGVNSMDSEHSYAASGDSYEDSLVFVNWRSQDEDDSNLSYKSAVNESDSYGDSNYSEHINDQDSYDSSSVE